MGYDSKNLYASGRQYKMKYEMLLWLLLLLVISSCQGASIPKLHYFHTNICRHVDPAPIVYLSNMFDTKDYFFPQFYIERKCATPEPKPGSTGASWATCLNGKHHCVTRYRQMEFLRIPNLNATISNPSISVKIVRVPVACECSSFIALQ